MSTKRTKILIDKIIQQNGGTKYCRTGRYECLQHEDEYSTNNHRIRAFTRVDNNTLIFPWGGRTSRRARSSTLVQFVYNSYKPLFKKLAKANMDCNDFIQVELKSNDIETFSGRLREFVSRLISHKVGLHSSTERSLFSGGLCEWDDERYFSEDPQHKFLQKTGWVRQVVYNNGILTIAPYYSEGVIPEHRKEMNSSKKVQAFYKLARAELDAAIAEQDIK